MPSSQTVTGRVETAYLATLRIVVLVVASLFVIGAAVLVADGVRRLLTPTEVAQTPVTVAPADVVSAVAVPKDEAAATATHPGTSGAAADKAKFDAFLGGPFARYYAQYVAIARRYNKPEDPLLTRDQVAQGLGYTLEAYQSGEDQTVARFVNDRAYAAQIQAAAAALGADRRVAGQLQQYAGAQKTAQACHQVMTPRRVWDSTSTGCADWWRTPMGCSVIRNMPEQRCEPAYPAGITSPAQAFGQMDARFRALWNERQQTAAEAAQVERGKRQATKAGGLPSLMQAAYVFGAFLVVMFIFVVIAIERHLRRLAQAAAAATPEPRRPQLQAAE